MKKFLIFFSKNVSYILGNRTCQLQRNLIKLFYTLNKNLLGETRCWSNLYYLLASHTSSFLIHPLSQTQSVRIPLISYHALCSACMTYGIPLIYYIDHQVLPTQPLLGKQRISLRVTSILRMCFCLHSQLTCLLAIKYGKIMNVFTSGDQ